MSDLSVDGRAEAIEPAARPLPAPKAHRGRGRPVAFGAAPEAPKATLALPGPVYAEVPFPNGRPPVRLDFTEIPDTPLVRTVARALVHFGSSGAGAKNRGGFYNLVRRARGFLAYLAREHPAITDLADVTPTAINGYEDELKHRYPETGGLDLLKSAIRTLWLAVQRHESPVPAALERRLTYTSARTRRAVRPVDAYSPLVHKRILDACKAQTRAVIERITVTGERQMTEGQDPRTAPGPRRNGTAQRGWFVPANVLWEAERLLDEGRHLSLAHLLEHGGAGAQRSTKVPNLADVYRLRYAAPEDLYPLYLRLILATRLPPECVLTLEADALSEREDHYELRYVKRRAGHDEAMTHHFAKVGPSAAAATIFRLVLRLTQHSRRRHPSRALWLTFTTGGYGAGFGATQFHRSVRVRFSREHDLRDDAGRPLGVVHGRRLRKTGKSKRYIETAGQAAGWADDHGPQVAFRHYALIAAHEPLHAQTVANAQVAAHTAALAAAERRPTVVPPAAEARLRAAPEPQAAAELGVAPGRALPVLDGAADVWVAACKDIRRSPFAPEGAVCPASAWGCLQCGNAVVTSRHLPGLLASLDHLLGQQREMSEAAWLAAHGEVFVRTERVVQAFPEASIFEARAVAEADRGRFLYLPIEMANAGANTGVPA